MTDARPLAALREAIAALRGELREMDVRTGMLQHLLCRPAAA